MKLTRLKRGLARKRLLVVMAGAVLVLPSLAGCGKASTGVFLVRFTNDLGAPAHLYQCVGLITDCLQTTKGARMLPSQTASSTARANVANQWLVQRDGTGRVSCIARKYPSVPASTPLIRLSTAVPGICGA